MILAIKWGKNDSGNENRVVSNDDINRFYEMGYKIYDAQYRPGLYILKKDFEKSAKLIR